MYRSDRVGAAKLHRVLATDLMGNLMGYAVFEGPERLVDWGIKDGRKSNPSLLVTKFDDLLKLYRPDTLVLEDYVLAKSRRSARALTLFAQIRAHAISRGVSVTPITWIDVRNHFVRYGGYTKYEIARLVAAALPALAHRLPPPRKPWKSEDSRMGIFDAAALGLTYFAQAGADRTIIPNS